MRHRTSDIPFLTGLAIEPENPWVSGAQRPKLKKKSGLTTAELCAGAGGQAIGLERAGIDHVCLVEINKMACSTLRSNRPKWNVIEQDLNAVVIGLPRVGMLFLGRAMPSVGYFLESLQQGIHLRFRECLAV